MKKIFLISFLLCFILISCGSNNSGGTSAPPPSASLTGRVLAQGDVPVAGALVILGAQSWTTETDEDGNFAFSNVPPGNYLLRVIDENDYFKEDNLTLTAGNNTTTQTLVIDPGTEDPNLADIETVPNTGLPNTPFEVSVDVTDRSASGIDEVQLVEVTRNQVVPLSGSAGGGEYTASVPAPSEPGTYQYKLFAVDNQGHVRTDNNSVTYTVETQAVVSGIVTQAVGGSPVEGATVSCQGTTIIATTGADGAYTMTVPAGTRTIVSQKTGFASSRLQDLVLAQDKQYTVNLIQYPIFNPQWAVGALTLNVTGITEGQEVSDPTTINLSASGGNPVQKLQLWVGCESGATDASQANQSTLSYQWNPSNTSAQGNTFIYMTAQDVNFNWCARRINLQVVNPGTYTLGRVNNFVAYANTFGENLEAYGFDSKASIFTMPNGQEIDLKAAPPNSTILVNLSWTALSNITGYRIWRSINSGAYKVIASTLTSPDQTTNKESLIDSDPVLTPGQNLSYQIQAYRGATYGPYTAAPNTTILDKFTVTLVAPGNQTTGISIRPTFSWSISSAIGYDRLFRLYLWRKNDDSLLINGYQMINKSSQLSTVPLENTKVYQWDIFAAARGSWSSVRNEFTAFSYPKQADPPNAPANSSNGGFIFTTTTP